MTKTEFLQKREAIKAEMANLEGAAYDAKMRELQSLQNDFAAETEVMNRENAMPKVTKDANAQMREAIKAVRSRQMDGDFQVRANSQNTITSSVIASGDVNNMATAGIPLTIKELVNPLEMGLIYDKLGIQVAIGVKGNIQWPVLDTAAEVSVGGELDAAADKTLDFSKITATPVKLGISIAVSNEAINDEAFDLVGCITSQMNKAVGRVINQRVLALAAPSAKANFAGPLVAIATATGSTGLAKQKVAFATAGKPTYAELKAMKGKVLGTGAQMAGFCYVMDAAMYSLLEATPKDAGSGRFVIENGKIDGDLVFLTADTAYAGKVVAGCFGYCALNQHGETHFIVDPYTQAKKNVTVFTLNGDWSLTTIQDTPFSVGA